MNTRIFSVLLLVTTAFFAAPALAATWHVDVGAPSGGDGLTWGTAFQAIQEGIDAASPADEVWVKAGTYLLSAQIAVDEEVGLYGGFDGTESAQAERDWVANVTTIDGGDSVRCLFVTADNVTLDGFVIANGYTDPALSVSGAGMLHGVVGTEIHTTIANCTFLNNHSGRHGGAITSDEGDLAISNCTFQGNTAPNRGGAICLYAAGNPVNIGHSRFTGNTGGSGGVIYVSSSAGLVTITDTVFDGNSAAGSTNNDGGAILCDAPLTLTGCVFTGNTATRHGTIATRGDTGKPFEITNCLFAGNSAVYGAGVDVNGTSGFLGSMVITNCTFAGNLATGGGGAIYNLKALDAASVFTVTNSILWEDSVPEIGGTGGMPTVSYSDVQGGYLGTGNLDLDPLFVSGGVGAFYLSQTAAGQGSDSPCVNAGDPATAEWGWRSLTTRTDQEADAEPADMGYHYPTVCTDDDGDTYAVEGGVCGAIDCDDTDPAVSPGAVEECGQATCSDTLDNDCDGVADAADPDCAMWCPAAGQSSMLERMDGSASGSLGSVLWVMVPVGMTALLLRLRRKR